MAYHDSPDLERAGRIAFYLAAAGIGIGIAYAIFGPHAPQPANSRAFGCYTNSQTAPILLDRQGMAILQREPIRVSYRLEHHKTAITLVAEAPIRADLVGERYLYSVGTRGSGWFMDFIQERDGRSYGEFDENQLRTFEMLATDGTDLAYRKASDDSACIAAQPARSSKAKS